MDMPRPTDRSVSLATLLAALLVVLTTSASAQRRFEILDLGDLNPTPHVGVPLGINDHGVITGFSNIAEAITTEATVWIDGRAQSLGRFPGDDISDAARTNEIGRTVGTSSWIEYRGHITIFWPTACVFENGAVTELISLATSGQNWELLSCADVNRHGHVIGGGRNLATETSLAYLFREGILTELPTLGGSRTSPVAINDAGVIVGQSWTTGGQNHAFVLQNGVMTDLGTFGGRDSRALDINEAGQIVGWSQSPSSPTLATLWQNGQATNLGTLGGNQSHAAAINERGQIVGFSTDAQNHAHMFFYENGQMVNPILTLPPSLGFAGRATCSDINEAGQFVGTAYRINRDAPVVLTPVDLTLSNLVPAIPGQPGTIQVSGLAPNARAYFTFSEQAGMTRIPGCPGAPLLLSGPSLATVVRTDAAGQASITRRIPPGLSGKTVRIQVVERNACRVSNVVTVTFP